MKIASLSATVVLAASVFGQNRPVTDPGPPPSGNAPIYHVTVVQRTVKAVNYFYRQGPTPIDFRGTVLLPEGKGGAVVESRQGRADIDANFEHFKASQEYGREYLTYVLWAITPEGRPHNLGEIVPDHSNNGHLHVTTDLQAFAMIVTAEPYAEVRQPSDVVVLENQLRPDTAGSTEAVNAKYELLPRGQYTWNINSSLSAEIANAPKVSTREFETLTELYQAENAVGIAGSAGAAQFAPETLARAQSLLQEAQQMHAAKGESHSIIEIARQASQTAEDARLIAVQREQQAALSAAQAQANQASQQVSAAQQAAAQAQVQAAAQVQQAQQEALAANQRANALQQQADADRAALLRAQTEAAEARQRAQQAELAASQAQAQIQGQANAASQAARVSAVRVRLLENLNSVMPVTDTPRGLVVTIPDADFSGESVHGTASERIARIAAIVSGQPGLRVTVEGYSDRAAQQPLSETRAYAVRRVLSNNGLSAASITAKGFGDSRPLGPAGQVENSRVEIVVAGDAIGTVPFWDRTYPLSSSR
jgi:outer membrane protein OmpA-like peptidoglycan-associated protein